MPAVHGFLLCTDAGIVGDCMPGIGDETGSDGDGPVISSLRRWQAELAPFGDGPVTVADVHSALQDLWKKTEDDEDLRAIAIALGYLLVNREGYRSLLDDADDGQPLSEGPFGPMWEMKHPEEEGWIFFPPALRRLPTAMLDVWVEYAQESALHPLLRARLADLLWVRKHEQHHRWHEIAVGAYIELVDHLEVRSLEQETAVIRAVNLSRESRQTSLEQDAWDALNRLVAKMLEEDGEHYGPVARCLGYLAAHGQPCDNLLDRAIKRYRSDPERHKQLWQIKAQAASSQADRERCTAEAINILVADANSSPGLRQLALLQEAWALAHQAGMHELMSDLQSQIARVNLEDSFTRFEAKVEVSQEEIEATLQEVIGEPDTLRDALFSFGHYLPIAPVEQNQQEATSLMEAFPLQYLFRRVNIASVEDQIAATDVPSAQQPGSVEVEVRRIEGEQIGFFSWVVGCHFLREVDERYAPTLEALVEHFSCVWITEDLARRIAKSYLHWRDGDQDSAVSVIILTIEAIIRRLASTIGITVTQVRPSGDGRRVGEAVTLGRLLENLAEHPSFVDAPIIRYMDSALTNRWSLNLRNLLTHSLTSLTETQYAVLFHIVCLVRWMADHAQPAADATQQP